MKEIAKINRWLWIVIGAFILFCPTISFGPIRPNYSWRTPSIRGISTVGGDFTRYSAGAPQGNYSPSNSLLRSSISASSGFNLYRRSLSSISTPYATGFSRIGQYRPMRYTSGQIKFTPIYNEITPQKIFQKGSIYNKPSYSIQTYLAGLRRETLSTGQAVRPITSFVPTEEAGTYRLYMEKGERALKEGRYYDANASFRMALSLGQHPAETHLALVHSYCAQERYHLASYHLVKAIEHFPDLPLASISIRSFYGSANTFVSILEKLEKAAKDSAVEPELYLLLGYFQYFDNNPRAASTSIREAYELCKRSKNERLKKAILTFWKGMVAAGKVHGTLATTAPAEELSASTAEPQSAQEKAHQGTGKKK